MLNTDGRFMHTKYCGILMLNTVVGRFIYTILGILYVEHWEDLFTQNTERYLC